MRGLQVGTFAHELCVSLSVSLLGIGDCGEGSAQLGLRLIQAGFGNLAFVAVMFPNAKEALEHLQDKIITLKIKHDFVSPSHGHNL